jgi:curved DNA-binding protein
MARPVDEIGTVRDALALLGLTGSAEPETLAAAFRAAIKAARPDAPGGDADRFRRLIAAYRLIQAEGAVRPALAAPARRPAPMPVAPLTPLEALTGAGIELAVGARRFRIRVPAGLRTGEHLRLKGAAADGGDLYLPVLIRPGDGLTAVGDDLYMAWPASPRLMRDGGRIEIETHAGPRAGWVTPGLQNPVRLRLKGLGLPARGRRPAGHLFVSLIPSADAPSSAEDLLARFTRVWTPERLAA